MNEVINLSKVSKDFILDQEKRDSLFEKLFESKKNVEVLNALKNINLKIRKGETVGVIGPNGGGKSTLLKVISGILIPTKGRVKTKGKIVSFLELGVGFHQELTARENVFLYGSIMGLSEEVLNKNFREIIEFAGLERFEDTKLKNFSSGMQVRLAFSTAIQTNPDILLVDEVLSVGDLNFQRKCLKVFNQFKKEKKTIIFVSHDLNIIKKFCKKTILLKDGEIVKKGRTQKVINEYLKEVDEEEKRKNKKGERWGNKKVIIEDVKFLNNQREEEPFFLTKETLIVRLFYKTKGLVKNPIFGIQFYKKEHFLFGINTDLAKYDIKKIQGTGYLDFKIKSIPFNEGNHYITCSVHSKNHVHYDWHNKMHEFKVKKAVNNNGLITTEFEWELN